MKNIKHFAQRYVDWVIRLGRIKFSLLGVVILAVLALCTQFLLSLCVVGTVYWHDVGRSVFFGLISAPFVIYFFTLLVEKLEKSRLELAKLVDNLRREVSERMIAERKLSVALNDLEQSSRNKTALMTTISHELRTCAQWHYRLKSHFARQPLESRTTKLSQNHQYECGVFRAYF